MNLLKLVPAETKIDFIGKRWIVFCINTLLVLISIYSFVTKGFNLGIDFKGGIVIEANYQPGGQPQPVDMAPLREKLGALHMGEISLQTFGNDSTILLRVQQQEGDDNANSALVDRIKGTFGEGWHYARAESVGPTVGRELMHDGFMAIGFALLAIGAYVAFRFEWQFGLSALIRTCHDVFVSLGLISFLQLEFNLTTMAALMLLAGYSINDTVIIFDRIRETLRRYKQLPLIEVINLSVNRTLSRTVMTSTCTLSAIIPMLFLSHETLLNFTAVIVWGIVVGTVGSIYVASALLLYLPPLRRGQAPTAATAIGPAA